MLPFEDDDGQGLELVGRRAIEGRTGWTHGPVPKEHTIRGFHTVTLLEDALERTESVLLDTLGFRQVGDEGNRFRYEAGKGGAGTIVDVVSRPKAQRSTSENPVECSSRSPPTNLGLPSMSPLSN